METLENEKISFSRKCLYCDKPLKGWRVNSDWKERKYHYKCYKQKLNLEFEKTLILQQFNSNWFRKEPYL